MSDDEWETDPDFVNDVSEQQQRWGGQQGAGGKIDMRKIEEDVKAADAEKVDFSPN